MNNSTAEVVRRHAEDEFAEELEQLGAVDARGRPPSWRLSPWAVTEYLLGGTLANGFEISPKYIGDRRLVEVAVATLATDRALLLLGLPGVAKSWLAEHLAAAISADSTLLVQGTAGTAEEAIRYGWNYALLLAEGPSLRAIVPSPIMLAMQTVRIARIEELTRMPSEVQDALITVLSEKTLPIPELNSEVQARKGFNIIGTANTRDRGVNELSSALKRRFNTVVMPVPASLEEETRIVALRVAALGRALELPAEPPALEEIRRVVTIFRELRAGATEDGQARLKIPSGTLSPAEAISVITSGLTLAAHFGDGHLSASDVAASLLGAIVQDPVRDTVAFKEYLETVMRERDGWRDLYRAARELLTEGVAVLGVRHHGPGSSRSVLRALQRLTPDLVLVEGPPDAQALIPLAIAPAMRPPVALVIYPPAHPGVGVFYPFATFSPEWNAVRYALGREIPVRFCDLPQAVSLADVPAHRGNEAEDFGDPIQMLAQAAGEADPERWWERLVEQRADDADVFRAVTEAMAAVRETLPAPPIREARREAAMRQAIRRGRSEGFVRIAVVCGAWHAPALETLPLRKTDDALLRGLKRVKVEATWVPWTASRLGYTSGYGAGVESPAWYRHLWETNGDLTTWLASAARLLRDEDLDASSAQVVDAVRLADALAALRGRPQPSLSEASEATLAVLCGGEPARMTLIHSKLVVGEEMGGLPEGVPAVPLQRDLEAEARRLRLRATAEERALDLDLRQPHQLEQSRFLHRLRILDIDWGRPQPLPRGKLGTFHELWTLRWQPESVLQVVEAGVYGNTVSDAATAHAIERGELPFADLGRVAALIELVLLADLEAALPRLVALLGRRSAESTDVVQMLRALPPLASTVRYGDVRGTDTTALAQVVGAIAERVTAGLGAACAGLDDEAAGDVANAIVVATQAIGVLSDAPNAGLVVDWWAALRKMLDRRDLTNLIAGTCTRLLLNAERLGIDEVADRLGRALARGTGPGDAARWIEGFLSPSPQRGGSGLVLATAGPLFGLIDDWLTSLSPDYFAQVLPLLRRTTSTFSSGERTQIAERVRTGDSPSMGGGADDLDLERAALVEPIVLAILGIEQ